MKQRFCFLVITLFLTTWVMAEEPKKDGTKDETPKTAKITISLETTYFTGPQRPDGQIDYLAALNERLSKGVTKDNNILVGVFTLTPGELEYPSIYEKFENTPKELTEERRQTLKRREEMRQRFATMMGLEAAPTIESLHLLQPPMGFADSKEARESLLTVYTQEQLNTKVETHKKNQLSWYKDDLEKGKIIREEYEKNVKEIDENIQNWVYCQIINDEWNDAMRKPWVEKDFPYLAQWIVSTDDITKQLIDYSKSRTRYYHPLITPDEQSILLYEILLPYAQAIRQTARFLLYRGNWDFAHENYDQAFECAFSSIRMGNTMRNNAGTIVEDLMGIAMIGIGDAQLTSYLSLLNDKKDATWILQKKAEYDLILKEYAQQPLPPPWMASERSGVLGIIQMLVFEPEYIKESFMTEEFFNEDGDKISRIFKKLFDADHTYDWDVVLQKVNSLYDDIEDMTTLPSLVRQLRAADRFETRLKEYYAYNEDDLEIKGDENKKACDFFITQLAPAISAKTTASCRIEWTQRVTSLMFSLTAYRTDYGEYPDSLEQLVPKYLDQIPDSPHTEKPMRYVKLPHCVLIPNDDYYKFDGSEPELEEALKFDDVTFSNWIYPAGRHSVFVIQIL